MGRKINVSGQLRHLSGWVRDRPDPRDKKLAVNRLKTLFLPKRMDLREFCSKIEDQGNLGSCTANASTSAMEFLYKKSGLPQPDLSRLYLYFATRVWVAQEEADSDNGAMIRDVMKALATHGVCVEGLWPYERGKFFAPPSAEAKADAEYHQILHYYRCPGLRYIKACLADGYPCVGGFVVPESMDTPKVATSGFVPYPSNTENFVGGHAVLFVGYDDDLGCLIFQNSWGPSWGAAGFGYLPYDYVNNGLANDFWTIRRAEM